MKKIIIVISVVIMLSVGGCTKLRVWRSMEIIEDPNRIIINIEKM